MPSLSLIGKLTKSDRRNEWKALKSKHDQALAAKQVKFDAGFGKALDNYQAPVKVVTKLFVDEKLSQKDLQKVVGAARSLEPLALSYVDRVKGLGGPAEKELTAFLKAVIADCQGWEQVLDMFEDTGLKVGPAQQAAVQALNGPLDRLMAHLENLGKSIGTAKAELSKVHDQAEKPKIKPVKQSAAEWATLQAMSEAAWRQLLRTKANAIIDGLDRFAAKRTAALQDLAPLGTAAKRFTPTTDYESLKARARTVSATSLADLYEEAENLEAVQNDPEFLTRLGFNNGSPTVQNSRAAFSVTTARKYAADLGKAIQKMP
jgi:hypothetical protein